MRNSKKAARLLPDEYEFQLDYAVNFYAGENLEVKVNWSDAARAWQKAGEVAGTTNDRFYSYLNEGRTWSRAKNYRSSVTALKAALAILPDSAVAADLLKKAESNL